MENKKNLEELVAEAESKTPTVPPRPGNGDGENPEEVIDSARIQACKGSKRGDTCRWLAANGDWQDGKCYYAHYGINNGKLYCANRDYRNSTETSSQDNPDNGQ